jgi:flagellar basal body-associated protein FliL
MQRRVAGVATVVLVVTTIGAWAGVIAAAVSGVASLDGAEATPESVASNDWHAAVAGVELAAIGLVVMLGLGGALAWYLRDAQTAGVDDETTSERAVGASTADAGQEQTPTTDEQSDEQRVVELLEENDGQMKQAKIVEHTDWSKSKVSMLLSEMESDDEISKLRVGRENLISLAGEEPEAAGSPFEELQE